MTASITKMRFHRSSRLAARLVVSLGFAAALLSAVAPDAQEKPAPPLKLMSAESNGGSFVPVQGRLLDTRAATTIGGYTTPMQGGVARDVQVTGVAGVPASGVSAVVATFTAITPSATGYVSAHAVGESLENPLTLLTYVSGGTESSTGIVEVGTGGKISVLSSAQTNLAIDVQGYYTEGPTGSGGYVPIAPERLVDSRVGRGIATARISSGSTVTIDPRQYATIPANATALALNIVAVEPSAAGYLTAYPADLTAPPTASLNFANVPADATGAIVPLAASGSSAGKFKVRVANASTHLIIDVTGYFAGGTDGAGGSYYATMGGRILDTRNVGGALTNDVTRTVSVAGKAGVPASGANAVAVTITAVPVSNSGYLSAWRTGAQQPALATSLNYTASRTTSTMAIVQLGDDGTFEINNKGGGTTHLVIDVQGWFSDDNSTDQVLLPANELDPAVVIGTTLPSSPIAPGQVREFTAAGKGGIPSTPGGAVALSGRLTIKGAQSAASVRIYDDPAFVDEAATFTYPGAGAEDVRDDVVVSLSNAGKFLIRNDGSASVHVEYVADTWFSPSVPTSPAPTTPSTGNLKLSGTVKNGQYPATGAGVRVVAWPATDNAVITPGTEVLPLELVNTTVDGAGKFSTTIAESAIPAGYKNVEGNVDVEYQIHTSSKYTTYSFTAQRAESSQTTTQGSGAASLPAPSNEIVVDLQGETAYEKGDDPAQWRTGGDESVTAAQASAASAITVEPNTVTMTTTNGDTETMALNTAFETRRCRIFWGDEYPPRKERFMSVYNWSGAKAAMTQTSSSSHKLGIGFKASRGQTTWTGSSSKEITTKSSMTIGNVVNRTYQNSVVYQRQYSACQVSSAYTWDKAIPIRMEALFTSSHAIEAKNWRQRCQSYGGKRPATWVKDEGSAYTKIGGVELGFVSLNAQAGYTNSTSITYNMIRRSKACSNDPNLGIEHSRGIQIHKWFS